MPRIDRTTILSLFMVLAAIQAGPASLHAGITPVGAYHLGEAGSVGGTSPYLPLINSIGGANNFTFYQPAGGTPSFVGGIAPGSTAALNIDQSTGGVRNTGYETTTGFGLTTDYSYQLFFKTPDITASTANSYIFASLNELSSTGLSLELANGTVNLLNGTDITTRVTGFTYAVNQTIEVTVVNYNGQVSLYSGLNSTPAVSTTALNGTLDALALGVGYVAPTNRGANGTFDELNIRTFNHTTDSLASVLASNGIPSAVPEPSSIVLMTLGGVVMVGLQWKRRQHPKAR